MEIEKGKQSKLTSEWSQWVNDSRTKNDHRFVKFREQIEKAPVFRCVEKWNLIE